MDSDEEIPMDFIEESDSYLCTGDDEEEAAAEGEECSHRSKKDYTVLREESMKQLQEDDISKVSSVLSVSRGIACTLLLHKSWKLSSVFEDWFADEDGLRTAIGISRKQLSPKLGNYCKVCLENVDIGTMLSAACGHLFCSDCWKAHVSISINDGPGCLSLHCPEPKCKAIAGLDMVESLAADEDKQTYYKYLYRSYVELSKNRKWCPAPGCDAAVEFDVGGSESYDVCCDCSYNFCWNCTEEAHRPVSCATVAKWIEKNSSETDNTTWIMAFTKPCPKCKRQIEKNHGCNHMTCSQPCRFEFCWLCLDTWNSYYHRCNKFETAEASSIAATRTELMRYSHYFERWISNHRSRNIALADLARVRKEYLPLLLEVQGKPDLDLQFVVEAWDQIVECRRVLKWSYAYGFYIEAEKKALFECLQGGAEAALERLHHCAENEMKKYVEADAALDGFREFCKKLKSLTKITRDYFENLVKAFENDLCEVESSSLTRPCKKLKVASAYMQSNAYSPFN